MSLSQYALDFLYTLTSCITCFPQNPTVSLNGTSYKILRLLGEGGFSLVYLVQSPSGSLHALKKIRCPFGQESLDFAMREVKAYGLFGRHKNLMYLEDHAVVEEGGRGFTVFGGGAEEGAAAGGKTVYILLPYFQRGTLQDGINANLINHSHFPLEAVITLFIGVCKGLERIHNLHGEGGEENTKSWAHRDIKPGNVMIDNDGSPVLMDFGSLAPSPLQVPTRTVALQIQDTAAEHSTLPFRAPELFDVKTGSVIGTEVDIWSLGCTIYAALVGVSPFEREVETGGGSLNMAVMGGTYSWPELTEEDEARKEAERKVRALVARCLTVEPGERPTAREVREGLEEVLGTLDA